MLTCDISVYRQPCVPQVPKRVTRLPSGRNVGYTRARSKILGRCDLLGRNSDVRKSPTRRNLLIAAGAAPFATAAAALAWQGDHQHQSLSSAEKEKQAFPFLTLKMFIETSSEDTKGAVSIVRVFVPAGDGPPPHVHSREDEIHTVVRGHYRLGSRTCRWHRSPVHGPLSAFRC